MATLTRRKEPVNLNDLATVPLPFIFEHIDKCAPTTITNGFSKAMILYHISDSKTFNSAKKRSI
jgi:hypothetical protein